MSYLSMFRVNDKDCRGLEVPLRALWRKAIGGGGRLRQATVREEKEAREEDKRRSKCLIYSLEYFPVLGDFEAQGLRGIRGF